MIKFITGIVAVVALAVTPLVAGYTTMDHDKSMKTMDQENIVKIAASNSDFSTLVTAIQAADLANALEGQGPFTVFAPTNEAFNQLPEGTLQDLLKPENKEKLASILKYHVVPGKVTSKDVKTMQAPTLNGKTLDIVVEGEKVTVNGATVEKVDIEGSNGVIHVIDKVLIP